MPLARIDLAEGKTADYRRAIGEVVYDAQVEVLKAPKDDRLVDDSVRYQQIDGFGASLTDSSAWLLWNKLSGAQRKEMLEMLFSPSKGMGLSVLRQPMGASDFALEDYSYDDVSRGESDPELKKFSIDHDRAYIIPILREALALNPNLKIIATPWSAPGWMKTSGSMIQGSAKRGFAKNTSSRNPDLDPWFAHRTLFLFWTHELAGRQTPPRSVDD